MKRFLCSLSLCVLLIGGASIVVFGDSDDFDFSADAVQSEKDDSVSATIEDSPSDVSESNDAGDTNSDAMDSVPDETSDTYDIIDSDDLSVGDVSLYADTVLMMSVLEDTTFPAGAQLVGGLFMDVTTSQLGRIIIFVPTDYQYKSFTKSTSGQPVNIRGTTITGYSYDGNDYSVRWSSFGQAQYRSMTGTSYNWYDLNITKINSTNIVFVETLEDLPVVPDTDILLVIMIFFLGVIVLCQFMKRF